MKAQTPIKYEFHPLANLFPMLAPGGLQALAADIKQHGLKTPILLHEGKILDGRNRYDACQIAGVEPRYESYNGTTPAEDVFSWNIQRRHLTTTQRACVGVREKQRLMAEAKQRMAVRSVNFDGGKGEARTLAAAKVGVSAGYITEAEHILDAGPALFSQMERGEITLQEAKRTLGNVREIMGLARAMNIPGDDLTVLAREARKRMAASHAEIDSHLASVEAAVKG
jgi:hypothetical protein